MPQHFSSLLSESTYEAEFQHMLRGIEGLLAEKSSLKVEGLSQHQVDRMLKLAKLPAMKNLPQKMQSNPVSVELIGNSMM